jgi:hypothetical protein
MVIPASPNPGGPVEGYITLALGSPAYLEMACDLARSLRYFDPGRRICLVHDYPSEALAEVAGLFDEYRKLEPRPGYLGCMNKIRLYDVSPYDRTMYIDADCLLVKDKIGDHWARMRGRPFCITGEKATSGRWNAVDIAQATAFFRIPYIVRMNSGVFYFEKSEAAEAFFADTHFLFATHRDDLSNIHKGRSGQYADEPILGTAMGRLGIEPYEGIPGAGSLMVTTWRARGCDFAPERSHSRIVKPTGFYFGLPLVAKGWVHHSPTIAHFVGLSPRAAYERTAGFFRAKHASGRSGTATAA